MRQQIHDPSAQQLAPLQQAPFSTHALLFKLQSWPMICTDSFTVPEMNLSVTCLHPHRCSFRSRPHASARRPRPLSVTPRQKDRSTSTSSGHDSAEVTPSVEASQDRHSRQL